MNKDVEKQKEKNEKLGGDLVDFLVEIYGDLKKKEKEKLCRKSESLEVIKYV